MTLSFKATGTVVAACTLLAAGAFVLFARGAQEPKPAPSAVAALLYVARDSDGKAQGSAQDFEVFKRTQMALIQSRLVLGSALKRPEVAALKVVKDQKDPVSWLEENLRVDYPHDAEILRISMRGSDPKELAKLVNAVAGVYVDEFAGKSGNGERLAVLKDLLDGYQQILHEKRHTLEVLSQAVGARNPQDADQKRQSALQLLADCLEDLRRVQREQRAARLDLIAAKIRLDSQPADKKEEAKKEIGRVEEKLAILAAQKEHLQAEKRALEEPVAEVQATVTEIEAVKSEIRRLQDKADEIGQLVAPLNFAKHFPPRIRLLQSAEASPAK